MKNDEKVFELKQLYDKIRERCVVSFFNNAGSGDAIVYEQIATQCDLLLNKAQKHRASLSSAKRKKDKNEMIAIGGDGDSFIEACQNRLEQNVQDVGKQTRNMQKFNSSEFGGQQGDMPRATALETEAFMKTAKSKNVKKIGNKREKEISRAIPDLKPFSAFSEDQFSLAFQKAYQAQWNEKINDDRDEEDYLVNKEHASLLEWKAGENPYRDLQRVSLKCKPQPMVGLDDVSVIFLSFLQLFEQDLLPEEMRRKCRIILAKYGLNLL